MQTCEPRDDLGAGRQASDGARGDSAPARKIPSSEMERSAGPSEKPTFGLAGPDGSRTLAAAWHVLQFAGHLVEKFGKGHVAIFDLPRGKHA